MPFSTTVRGSSMEGPGWKIWGDWSGSAGDAAGTLAIGSPYVRSAIFQKLDSDNTSQTLPKVTQSVSGAITTLTIENQDNVTTGRFVVEAVGR